MRNARPSLPREPDLAKLKDSTLLKVAATSSVIGRDFENTRPRINLSRLGKFKAPEPAPYPKKERQYLSMNQSLEGNRMQIAQVSSRELINLRYDRFRENSRNISLGGSADRQHASAADALDTARGTGKKLAIKQRRPSPLLKRYASKKLSLQEGS